VYHQVPTEPPKPRNNMARAHSAPATSGMPPGHNMFLADASGPYTIGSGKHKSGHVVTAHYNRHITAACGYCAVGPAIIMLTGILSSEQKDQCCPNCLYIYYDFRICHGCDYCSMFKRSASS
jgi:hypothetical protein